MEFAAIVSLIATVANVIVKAIPFVEELFDGKPDSGPEKAAIVMNMAQVAVSGVEGAFAKNNPQWAFLAPLAKRFIDDAIAAVNQIQAQAKAQED
jgi:hypothetical protein